MFAHDGAAREMVKMLGMCAAKAGASKRHGGIAPRAAPAFRAARGTPLSARGALRCRRHARAVARRAQCAHTRHVADAFSSFAAALRLRCATRGGRGSARARGAGSGESQQRREHAATRNSQRYDGIVAARVMPVRAPAQRARP